LSNASTSVAPFTEAIAGNTLEIHLLVCSVDAFSRMGVSRWATARNTKWCASKQGAHNFDVLLVISGKPVRITTRILN